MPCFFNHLLVIKSEGFFTIKDCLERKPLQMTFWYASVIDLLFVVTVNQGVVSDVQAPILRIALWVTIDKGFTKVTWIGVDFFTANTTSCRFEVLVCWASTFVGHVFIKHEPAGKSPYTVVRTFRIRTFDQQHFQPFIGAAR